MAVFKHRSVTCSCGASLDVLLADSVNAGRCPESRQEILAGEPHRTACDACGREFTVERAFTYTDFERDTFILVKPRGERHEWRESSDELDRAVSWVPESLSNAKSRKLRVVFGMDELREKLVAQDAELDDRTVEMLKVLVISEHPFLIRRARLRLVLVDVTNETCDFVVSYEHGPERFRVSIPTWAARDLQEKPKALINWAGAQPEGGLYAINDH